MSTNEKLNAVLEHGLRERLTTNPKEVQTRTRLGQLYGYSPTADIVKTRARIIANQGPQSRPTELDKKNVQICKCGVKQVSYPDKVAYGDQLLPISSCEVHPGPWYVGYNNAARMSGERLQAKANRYGARGALNMELQENQELQLVLAKEKKKSPEHLRKRDSVDIYARPLQGTPLSWSGLGAYPQGSKLSVDYGRSLSSPGRSLSSPGSPLTRRPPTAETEEPTRRPEGYERALAMQEAEAQRLQREVDREREKRRIEFSRKHKDLPERPKEAIALKTVPCMSEPKREKTLHMKNFTMIHHSDADITEELEMTHRCDDRLQTKWKDLAVLNSAVRSSISRRKETQDIGALLRDLKEAIEQETNGSRFLVRDQFCAILLKRYPNLPLRTVNRIYSAFDLARTDRVDYRDFMACLRVLRHVGTPKQLLEALVDLYATFLPNVPDRLTLENVCSIFSVCAMSTSDMDQVAAEVKRVFASHLRKEDQSVGLGEFWEIFVSEGQQALELLIVQFDQARPH